MKEVVLKILNNGHVYITWSVITRFSPMDPDDFKNYDENWQEVTTIIMSPVRS